MNGLIVNLFKEPITTKYNDVRDSADVIDGTPDYTVWMHYDSIKIDKVTDFGKYFTADTDEVITDDRHEGDMQSMHLYFLKFRDGINEPNLKVYDDQKRTGKYFAALRVNMRLRVLQR